MNNTGIMRGGGIPTWWRERGTGLIWRDERGTPVISHERGTLEIFDPDTQISCGRGLLRPLFLIANPNLRRYHAGGGYSDLVSREAQGFDLAPPGSVAGSVGSWPEQHQSQQVRLFLSLPLSLSHSFSHSLALSRALSHFLSHTLSHSLLHTLTLSPAVSFSLSLAIATWPEQHQTHQVRLFLSHTHTGTRTYSLSHSLSHSLIYTNTHSPKLSLSLTHAHTLSHTHSLTLSP